MPLANCVSREELSEYCSGLLSPDRAETVADHVEMCQVCGETLREFESQADALFANVRSALSDGYLQEPELGKVFELAAAIVPEASPGKGRTIAPAAQPDVGELLRDYRLLAKLGQGGMGTVYKAIHTHLDKLVAVKLLSGDRMRDEQAVARFRREMKAVGKLDHPNIVRALDAGQHVDQHYLVMEFVDGFDLACVSSRLGPLGAADACEMVRQAALGLDYAHRHRLVHRDIKPSNLILTADGQVKLLDLGLALLNDEGTGELTGTEQVMGTAEYMAPEQAGDSHAVDGRADLYSLGCTLFKLLTGRSPFSGPAFSSRQQKLLAHIQAAVPSLSQRRPELGSALIAIVERLLAKRPEARFATGSELAAALAPFCAGADLPALYVSAFHSNPTGGRATNTSPENVALETMAAQVGKVSTAASQPPDSMAIGSAAKSSRRRPTLRRNTLVISAAAAILAATLVVLVQTDRGELVITASDPGVQVSILRNRKPVEDLTLTTDPKHVSVRSGDVEVVVIGANADSFTVTKNQKVTLARGDTKLVSIERKPSGEPKTNIESAEKKAEDINREVAEWVVQHGGWVTVQSGSGEITSTNTLDRLPDEVARFVWIDFRSPPTPPISQSELIEQLSRVRGRVGRGLVVKNVPLNDAGFAKIVRLSCMADLTNLYVDSARITDAGLAEVKGLSKLETLYLLSCRIASPGFVHLRDLTELRDVNFTANRLTDAALAELRGLKLSTLNLQMNPLITDAGMAHLSDMSRLRVLGINDTAVGDDGLAALAGLSELEIINISGTKITAEGLKTLEKFPKLKWLYVFNLPITRESLSQICGLPNLEWLQLGGTKMQISAQDLPLLGDARKLATLYFIASPQLTDEWLEPLAKLTGLKELHLEQTSVTAAGVARFQAALPHCRILSNYGRFEPTGSQPDTTK